MSQMSVSVEVPDGLGVVDVLGTEAASVLYLSGDPVWLHAYDNHGSVGELAARAGPAAPRPGELGVLRDHLADPGLRIDKRSGEVRGLEVEPLRPLPRLLQRGRYLVSTRTMSRQLAVHDRSGEDWVAWYLGYGSDDGEVIAALRASCRRPGKGRRVTRRRPRPSTRPPLRAARRA